MEKNNKRHEVWSSLRDADFQENDVSDVLDGYQSSFMISNHTTKPSFGTQSLLPSEPRMIPERKNIEGMTPMTQHAAPVNVPDHWSMVHTKKTKKVDADDDDENMSPEEYFMRRSRLSSSSVMEGTGRKLKVRDLRKVRNAVLKKTGFLE